MLVSNAIDRKNKLIIGSSAIECILALVIILSISCASNKTNKAVSDNESSKVGFIPESLNDANKAVKTITEWTAAKTDTISKAKYQSWKQIPFNDPSYSHFVIMADDYRDWGFLKIGVKNTKASPKLISAANYNGANPVHLAQDKRVIIEGFTFTSASHWQVSGISVSGISGEKNGKIGGLPSGIIKSEYIQIVDCLVEHVLQFHFIQIINSSYNLVSNSVIRNKIEGVGRGDIIGVYINADPGQESRGNEVSDCEIYNTTDGVQLMLAGDLQSKHHSGAEYPETKILRNEIYITKELYRQEGSRVNCCAENGIDIKSGTKSQIPSDAILVKGNLIYGYRKTSKNCGGSSWGSAILIHIKAENIIVENNIIQDCNRGIYISENRRITVKNNLIMDMYSDDDKNSGMALVCGGQADIINNTIVGNKLAFVKYGDQKTVFEKNIIYDNQNNSTSSLKLNELLSRDNVFVGTRKSPIGRNKFVRSKSSMRAQDVIIENKKITNPKTKRIPNIIMGSQN